MADLPTQLEGLMEQILSYQALTTQVPYETEMALFMETFLKHFGFQTHHQPIAGEQSPHSSPARFNLLAEKGSGSSTLLIFAHMDMPPQEYPWISEDKPYFYLDNRIYGTGVLSVKGGLIAMLNAVVQIEPTDFTLKIALLADGAGQQRGAQALVKSDWLQDITLAISPQPVHGQDVIHKPHMIIARTDNEFLTHHNPGQAILNIEDYLKDYLNMSMIWHYPEDNTPESTILAQYAAAQSSPFPIVAIGPKGEINAHEEWVAISSIRDISHIFTFILNDSTLWLAPSA